ncbi:MAG: hypothetical protein L6437_04445, partial [Kiritimatiellae bacterium]|nr:hypothetical protein [Kiritimatiellia bacterium]
GIKDFLNDLPLSAMKTFESGLFQFTDKKYPELLQQIRSKGVLDEALETKLCNAIDEFKKQAAGCAVTNTTSA